MATVYKKVSSRPLTNYQVAINKAAQELCVNNPDLLNNRKEMISKAREKIIANGFKFAKGRSRSKVCGTSDDEPVKKRPKLSKTVKEQRLTDLEDELSDYSQQIEFKEKRITMAINSEDYVQCDQIKNEIVKLKQSCRELEAEKKHLKICIAQSDYYYKRKERSVTPVPASESDSDIRSPPVFAPGVSTSNPYTSSSSSHQDNTSSTSTDYPPF